MASADKPNILILSLSIEDYFDHCYLHLLDHLWEVSNLTRVKDTSGALQALSETNFKAIVITDQGLTHSTPAKKEVLQKIISYIEEGGLVIVGMHFPTFTPPKMFEDFFGGFGLPWKSGDYYRATFQFAPLSNVPPGAQIAWLPEPYSIKALHVKDARAQERIFVPVPSALTESRVDIPEPVDEEQAAVVGAKIGLDHLVYCGDVNGERESYALIMALCGLPFFT
ncbi:hypothetical protein N7456_005945 [Penicillium angulare]|uniref:Uncharacterized protein n=1 Tax=Penicillium angulare TaxID=116970 RepID=A0A9W9FZF7_9EURO|nr:hypothetical protein N7456_005945 [Penicillium angulare]